MFLPALKLFICTFDELTIINRILTTVVQGLAQVLCGKAKILVVRSYAIFLPALEIFICTYDELFVINRILTTVVQGLAQVLCGKAKFYW